MNARKYRGYKLLQLLLILLLLVGSVGIAIFPFDNRNLSVHFITSEGKYVVDYNKVIIASGDCKEVDLGKELEEIVVTKLRFYGQYKSMLLKEIGFDEFSRCIENMQGEVQWTSEGIVLTGADGIRLTMNDNYVKIMQELSKSFLQERIIYIGVYFCIICFLLFILEAIRESRIEENWNNHGPLFEVKKFVGDIKKYREYMVYAAHTDLKAEVADSYLNRLWWLLEPFFNMIVYVIVFGRVMGNSVENYSTFIFSALLMWNFFSKAINYSVKLVRNNKDIVTKVYIPKFIILLSNMILNFFKLLFSMLILVVMMIVFRVEIGFNLFWVIPAYMVMMLLAFGAGMIFMHFGVYVDDLSYAVGILLNMLMFLSGIFYDPMTTLPAPLNSLLMSFNPIAVVIDTMRNALLYNTASNLPILGMWFLISLIMCFVGVHIVYKNENSYVKIV